MRYLYSIRHVTVSARFQRRSPKSILRFPELVGRVGAIQTARTAKEESKRKLCVELNWFIIPPPKMVHLLRIHAGCEIPLLCERNFTAYSSADEALFPTKTLLKQWQTKFDERPIAKNLTDLSNARGNTVTRAEIQPSTMNMHTRSGVSR